MSDAFARRYKLLERIAIGGTAEVFHARLFADDGSDQAVVIKRVLPQFARDERFRRLFLEEACVAVTVNHPNIVRVLDHGELEQTCYIALELVEGKDLGHLLTRARGAGELPSAGLAAFITAQVGEALQFIHDKTSSEGTPLKIIHRDVSPQNILVSYQGDVKLTDFGIAKSAIRQESTVDGTLRGKLDYMAPEQAALAPVDHRTDIFALGCVLYKMVHGAPPFRGDNELMTLEHIRQGSMAVLPAELDAPEPVRHVLARALAKDKQERYQQAQELVVDLRAFMAELPSQPTSAELGAWARQQAEAEVAESGDMVENAVRQLLGGAIDGADSVPAKRGFTTVFAESAQAQAASSTAEVPSPPPRTGRLSPLTVALIVVAALGAFGWGLWAVRYFSSSSDGDPVDPVGDAGLAVPRAPEARAAQPDLRVEAPRVQKVRTRPAGALLLVDGRRVGLTPTSFALPASPFTVELRKAGYRPWTRRLQPGELSGPLVAALSPASAPRRGTGLLTINSLPWSRVKIDGTYMGNTPLIKLQVTAGKHRVELQGSDRKVRKAFWVTIRRGQRRAFTFDLTK